jgi:hypothetical protein
VRVAEAEPDRAGPVCRRHAAERLVRVQVELQDVLEEEVPGVADGRVGALVGVPHLLAQREAARRDARDGAAADQNRELGAGHAHRLFHAVDREGGVDVPLPVSSIADLLRGVVDIGGRGELGHDAVDLVTGLGHVDLARVRPVRAARLA